MADTTPSHKPIPAEAGGLATTQTYGEAPDAGAGGPGACVERGELAALLGPPRGPGEIGWLGPYRVLGVLGAGGMGVVFRAEDPRLNRLIALKTLRHDRAVLALNQQRFLREAQAVAALEHDHIVPIYHVGEDRGVPYLAMPLLKGETLDARLRRDGKLELTEGLRIGREIAEGLATAHASGLVHRDIKPANIWLEAPTGRVRILDFGLVRQADAPGASLTATGAIIGTPAYMAPEQAQGQPADPRSDLFSLGCVLYHALTGVRPFCGSDPIAILVAIAYEQPTAPGAVDQGLPPAVSDLIAALMAKAPGERPASAAAVAHAVAALERTALGRDQSDGAVRPAAAPAAAHAAPGQRPRELPAARTRARMRSVGTLVLGCAVVAFTALALFMGAVYLAVTRGIPALERIYKAQADEQRSWAEVARFWRPPPVDASPDRLFPTPVERFQRAEHDAAAEISSLNIKGHPGRHAVYTHGASRVDLYAYRATALEKEALYRRALEELNPPPEPARARDTSSAKPRPTLHEISGSATSPRLVYRLEPGHRRGLLWWDKDWLFVALTSDGTDPAVFLKPYLAALSVRGGQP